MADVIEKHPSYGAVSFTRVSGCSTPMFGSSLKHHSGFIELKVSTGRLYKDPGRYRVMDDEEGEDDDY